MYEKHYIELEKSYAKVGDLTWNHEDFLQENINSSRKLFTAKSLSNRQPKPRDLEVYALVSGLSFKPEFIRFLEVVQRDISEILEENLHFWVKPDNLGVEYAVFKWPDDQWDESNLKIIKNALSLIQKPPFHFDIRGVQINADGCVIAKGFDQSRSLFQIREQLKSELPFMPKKQSGWAHVPLGRILEPVGKERFARLKKTLRPLLTRKIVTTEIDCMKLVHETRWYMEKKTILAVYPFNNSHGIEL